MTAATLTPLALAALVALAAGAEGEAIEGLVGANLASMSYQRPRTVHQSLACVCQSALLLFFFLCSSFFA